MHELKGGVGAILSIKVSRQYRSIYPDDSLALGLGLKGADLS
jgi:hypothetical protein